MKQYITKKELKGYDFSELYHGRLFERVNEKDPNGYNGRYVSTWYYNGYMCLEEMKAVQDMIWCLTLNYMKQFCCSFKMGHMAQCQLHSCAAFVAEKMNTWEGEIIRWMRGMSYAQEYDILPEDHWGLNTLTVFVNK